MSPRADAQRNIDALLVAAREVFTAQGVDASVRAVAARAGVGTATLYRHFPRRADLIAAVFRHEIDECVTAASRLAEEHPPGEALELWIQRYTEFVATKHGLAAALHSGDPAYRALPAYFNSHLGPALQSLLTAAEEAQVIRAGVDPLDLLAAIANLSVRHPGSEDHTRPNRMVALLVDGLRYRASTSTDALSGS